MGIITYDILIYTQYHTAPNSNMEWAMSVWYSTVMDWQQKMMSKPIISGTINRWVCRDFAQISLRVLRVLGVDVHLWTQPWIKVTKVSPPRWTTLVQHSPVQPMKLKLPTLRSVPFDKDEGSTFFLKRKLPCHCDFWKFSRAQAKLAPQWDREIDHT